MDFDCSSRHGKIIHMKKAFGLLSYLVGTVLFIIFLMTIWGYISLRFFPCRECVYIQDPWDAYRMMPWLLRIPGCLVLLVGSTMALILGNKLRK